MYILRCQATVLSRSMARADPGCPARGGVEVTGAEAGTQKKQVWRLFVLTQIMDC